MAAPQQAQAAAAPRPALPYEPELPAPAFGPMDLEQDAAQLWAGCGCAQPWYFGSGACSGDACELDLGCLAAPEEAPMDCAAAALASSCSPSCGGDDDDEIPLLTLDLGGGHWGWVRGVLGAWTGSMVGAWMLGGAKRKAWRQAALPRPRPFLTPPPPLHPPPAAAIDVSI